ncbi:MAG: hypothetical protein D6729_01330 [Deltaproteobacteria bacterium]|nr:MAG: hypothetical protein D6729_01330 [Deltaproteobacteria bacterium]
MLLLLALTQTGCKGCRGGASAGTSEPQAAGEGVARPDSAGETGSKMPAPVWQATAEQRRQWIEAACAAGCDEKTRRMVEHLARSARLEPVDGGIRVTGIQAYSPWIVCHLDNGDRVIEPADHGTLLRACAMRKGPVVVLRRGERKTVLP